MNYFRFNFYLKANLFVFLTFFCSFSVFSISPAEQELIKKEQKELLENALIQRESLKKSALIETEIQQEKPEKDLRCFEISQINFLNSFDFSQKEQKKLLSAFQKPCLSFSEIETLVNKTTNFYIKKGFITSFASLESQDIISSKTLEITINSSEIEAILLDEKPSKMVERAFPNMIGKRLNLRDIEQGLEQINRLSSKRVTIDILPGKNDHFSIISLKLDDKNAKAIDFYLNVDNSGQKSTGEEQISTQISFENLFQFADKSTFSFGRNIDFNPDHESKDFSYTLSIPFGYLLFNYNYLQSDFLQKIALEYDDYFYRGKSKNHELSATKLFYRDGKSKLSAKLALNRKQSENYFAEQLIEVSSRKLTSITAGLYFSTTIFGGYFTFNPSFYQGLPSFLGAGKDENSLHDDPKFNFQKYVLSSSYFHQLPANSYYLGSFFAQTSPMNLFGTEQLSIGGEYSIRGFKADSISGNRGFYFRNEITKQFDWINSWQFLLTFSLDAGMIQSENNRVDGGTLIGSAIQIGLSNSFMDHTIAFGVPLYSPHDFSVKNLEIYYQLSFFL